MGSRAKGEDNTLLGNNMRRRDFLALIGAGAAGLATGCISGRKVSSDAPSSVGESVANRKPNIIVIVADDLGYGDVGFQGGKEIPTPNIDSIARNGVKFTNAYVSAPLCSPTRAGLVTGRYQQRFGHEFNIQQPKKAGPHDGLPLSETTIADDLKAAGYMTGIVGKWHLGYAPEFHPLQRGFQEFFGFRSAYRSFLGSRPGDGDPVLRGTEPVEEQEYLTDAFTREAVSFIDRHSAEPFFLYLTYNAVHHPYQAPQKYLDRFPNIADQQRRTYAAMLSAMDDGVGAVLSALKEKGLAEDTIVIFIGDNGGVGGQRDPADNSPLRATKSTVYEGGIRVPFVMQWPRRLPQGQTYDLPVSSLDIRATAVAAAKSQTVSKQPLDGVDIIPYVLAEKSGSPHEILFWGIGGKTAVRRGDWKLVQTGQNPRELYNLSKDPVEKNDLAGKEPQIAEDLTKALESWASQMAPPKWGNEGVKSWVERRAQK